MRAHRSSPQSRFRQSARQARLAGTPAALSTISSGSSRSVHVSEGVTRVIVTVTLNAALDRSLTVPIFKLGHRHRASNVLALAGGKGINVARALKRLDVPVVATGLAGGRTGTRIVEELTEEAILNDFVRIKDESRTSTAVVDPTSGTYTEINEWGPKVTDGGARDPAREAPLSRARSVDGGVRRLAATGGRRGLLRRRGARGDAARRPRRARRGGRAAAPGHRGRAVARLPEPARGGAARRPGARRRRRLPDGARPDRRDGRPQRPHHDGDRLLRRSSGRSGRCGATGPRRLSSIPSRSSAPATSCSRAGSRRWPSTVRPRRPCGSRWRRARHRCSRSAPAASTRRRPRASCRCVEVDELQARRVGRRRRRRGAARRAW